MFLAVTAVVAWLGLGIAGPVQAAAPVPVQIYAYDVHDTPAASIRTATERGPPATYDHDTADYAEDRLPLGTSARPNVTATPASCDYDDPARFAQTTRGSRAEGQVRNVAADAVVVDRSQVVAKSADDFVDLASASRRSHILDGEVRPNGTFGGGHRPGTGFAGKSEFPAGWSDDGIMHEISDIATEPSLVWRAGNRPGDFFVNGTRDGVDIEVLIRNNQIWTGYPTNLPRNP